MRLEPVHLGKGADGTRKARWRAVNGAEELALFGCDFPAAVEWISSMLAGGDEWLDGSQVPHLNLDDGDRLFESLYRALFGKKIELRNRCTDCDQSYELTLALGDIFPVESPTSTAAESEERLPGGSIVRSLRIADLLAAGRNGDELTARAVVERGSDDDDAIQRAVEHLSSSLIETVETQCPHCEQPQEFFFDLSAFLLACCARERPILLREVHLLARTYGWGLADILSLDRKARHELVKIAVSAGVARPTARAA